MQHHQSKKRNNTPLRDASEFYTITLGDNYTLTEAALNKHINSKDQKRASWFYPDLKLLSFKDGIAEILNKDGKTSFRLNLKVEKDKVHVACSCAMQVEKLCKHAYIVLGRFLIFAGEDYLKNFLPDGIVQTVIANRKYFETKPGTGNMLKPKPMLGSVYAIDEKLREYSVEDVLSLPASVHTKQENKESALCYILMIPRRNDLLPFLLPCLGKLNKAGNNIKSFGKFLSGTQKEYDALLTDEQRMLNKICYEMMLLVEKLPPELIHEDMLFNESGGLTHLLNLWQRAIILLQEQPAYRHPYFHKRQLRGGPSKSWLEKISMQKEVPVIQFQLIEKKDFYQLTMQPVIKKKSITNYKAIDTFFIGRGDNVYLLSSIRDAAVAEWMQRSGNRITVFKEHFSVFEMSFLQPLKKHYLVKDNRALK